MTPEWLSDVSGWDVRQCRAKPLGEGMGVIGSVNRLTLDTGDGPHSLIAKFSTRVPENRTVAVTYDMYRREIHFYRELAEHVPVRTPRCIAAEFDPHTQDFVLLLEDLAGLRVGDQVAGASLADATAVVDSLAALHAATWDSAFDGVVSHNFPAQRDGMAAGFRVGWPAVAERFPDLISEQARSLAPALADHIADLIEALTADKQSLVHADVRLDNILFDDDSLVLVDWQSVCMSSGEQDLAYFLTQSLADGLSSAEVESLIHRYHQGLVSGGVTGHTLDDCRERYRIASLYLLSWAAVIAGTLDMGNERGRQLARALLGRSLRAVEAMEGFELIRR